MATHTVTKDTIESTIQDHDIVRARLLGRLVRPRASASHRCSSRHRGSTKTSSSARSTPRINQELARQLNIQSIPTLMVFRENILVFSQPGALPPAAFEDLLTQVKDLNMDEVRAEIAAASDQGASA